MWKWRVKKVKMKVKKRGREKEENCIKKGLSCLKIASLWVNLRFDGVLKTPSFVGGGGVESTPPPFLFVKTIEKVIRLCTVLHFALSAFLRTYLSICYG